MPETLREPCCGPGVKGWNWADIMRDLVVQGGLEKAAIVVNPLSVRSSSCSGSHKENPFYITWMPDTYLLVTSKNQDPSLIQAFTRVVGYEPFVKYTEDNGSVTTEWDKVDPNSRYQELQKEGKRELTRLLE